MRHAARVAYKDLKLRLRDRSAVIIGVVAPLALAVIFNFVFGSALDTGVGLGLEYGIVDLDGSEISAGLASVLEEVEDDGILTVDSYEGVPAAEAAVESGDIDAYVVVPEGFGAAVSANDETELEIVGSIDAPTSTQIVASIADQYATGVEATRLAIATIGELSGVPPGPELFGGLSGDPASAAFSYQLEDVSAATRQLDGTTYYAAGMAVFFMFFTVQFGVLGLLEEERQGTLPRLFAAPIGRGSVIGGKAILAFVLGVVSMGVLAIATQLLIGASWGNPIGVAILIVTGVLAAVGIMGMVASIARTPEAAGNLGSIIAVILGMLGGVFFQIGQGDDFLSRLSFLTPHAWFMRGLAELADGAAWTAALPAAGAILLFALVTGVIAWAFLRRRFQV